ncbi:hypothetical protein [Actinoplanes regularis]|uniref:Uncharacterized protein n=1 Tax=Actinoplanes regularis TaxID=52697 RepID=A0A238Z0H9_9ACTN|nr:hypothetical protein [Actinoplanes regularis]GIE85679.1 hypothetical protein Are01nite_21590 [Actinoplanes regularis]SNR76364.1 hypothetical protein SAMN06264365_105298 [Actinoplanes regularis]
MGRLQRKRVSGEPPEVTAFFDAMLELHLASGRKSTRDIAKEMDGKAAHATVHRVFTGRRPPTTLRIVEAVVGHLDPDKLASIRALWILAVRACESPSPEDGAEQAGVVPPLLFRAVHQPPRLDDQVGREPASVAARTAAYFHGCQRGREDRANAEDSGRPPSDHTAVPPVLTTAGLPQRVPLPVRHPPQPDEPPVPIVRDAASLAAHTAAYFRASQLGPLGQRAAEPTRTT